MKLLSISISGKGFFQPCSKIQFETATSGGIYHPEVRKQWEQSMFGDSYDTATGFQRVKYGCLNVSGDIWGCANASFYYGNAVLVLQPDVRKRCFFFSKDTMYRLATNTLATNEFYAHILQQFTDDELASVMTVCKSARVRGLPSKSFTYKEVQIRGPFQLDRDILVYSRERKDCICQVARGGGSVPNED